ncbi:MAG TPA: gamma-glutamyl-gamma-aminobutyrate hydrolase family protein [Candidatus Angelobacter sp.]
MKPRIAIPEPCSYDREYSNRALPFYLQAIEESGGEPVLIPLELSPQEIARRITACSAVLLPGSKADVDPQKFGARPHPRTTTADPLRDAADELLLQDAYNMRKPVFGICYGLQSLNVWRTGTLLQHIETNVNHSPVDKTAPCHEVEIVPDSLLARDLGSPRLDVNSSHHQAADVAGDALRVVARSPGDGVVEAVEGTLPGHYVLAVQWHPERNFAQDESSQKLFRSFIDAARDWKPDSI